MSLLENNNKLYGYGDAPHALHITVNNLKIFKGGSGFSPSLNNKLPDPKVWVYIEGTAEIDDGSSVTIIGSTKTPVKRLPFSLSSFKDWETLSTNWETQQKNGVVPKERNSAENDDDNRLIEYINNVHENFDNRPPTISIGIYDEWFLECKVSEVIMDALANDFLMGHCSYISMQIELRPTLIDNEYSDFNDAVTFGLLNNDIYGYSGFGWVEAISWKHNEDGLLPNTIKGSG